KTGEIVLKTFENLNQKGRTIIIITHEMNVARHAKRIIQIRDGKVISDDKIKI
ncbi:macrolide ABC transporter ATP-binding protein, partial [Candidatus Falkowbacteria bacterium CG02_land_8_20_14_3_00_36_14]